MFIFKQKAAIGILIAASVIGILFQLFGFIGAWREHFCLTCTYTVLQVLGTISTFVNAFKYSPYWGSAVLSIIVSIVAILFLIDLRQIRNARPAGHY